MKKRSLLIYSYLAVAILTFACLTTPLVPQQDGPSPTPPLANTSEISPTSSVPEGPPMKPGDYKQAIPINGMKRQYILHVPPGYDGSTALPLMFVLHGFGGAAGGMPKTTGMNEKADQENFFVAYLNGTEGKNTEKGIEGLAWNAGLTPDLNLTADDVAFVRDLAKQLEGQLYVDSQRIYAAGFSNGAMMSHKLGASLPDLLAGVAVVEGTMGIRQPDGTFLTISDPIGPMPIIIVHGKDDTHIIYDGGQATEGAGKIYAKSVADAVAFWTQADGCTGAPQTETSADGNVITDDYTDCKDGSEVMLVTVINGRHEWPTAQGHTQFSATDAIWEFFSRHHR